MSVDQLVAILGALTALVIATGAVLVQVVALTKKVDGRLSQLLELTAASSHAEGKLEATTAAPVEPTEHPASAV